MAQIVKSETHSLVLCQHLRLNRRPTEAYDPKTVQDLLRHADARTTLQIYAHSVDEDRMDAQRQVLAGLGVVSCEGPQV